jgi:hypothetical protein
MRNIQVDIAQHRLDGQQFKAMLGITLGVLIAFAIVLFLK